MFYAGWIVPWVEEEPPRGSRLGRLSQVLFGKLHQQLQADAADLQVSRLDLPDTRSDLADSAGVEWLRHSDRHDLLVRAVAVGDLCLRLADTELRIVRVEGAHDDLKAGSDGSCKDHIRLVSV